MKRLTALLCFWFLLTGAISFASGIQVDALISGLRNPLTDSFLDSGLVYTYSAGTTASKSLYMDAAMTTASTNPVVLNAYGQALRFAKGKYKFVIKTAGGTTLWTLDNLEYDSVATLASKTANPFGPTMSVTNFSTPNLTATAAANFSMNGYKITNLATPTSAYDAATYQYVASEVTYLASNTLASFTALNASIASTTASNTAAFASLTTVVSAAFNCSPMVGSTTFGRDTYYLASGALVLIEDFNLANPDTATATFHVTVQGDVAMGEISSGGITIFDTSVELLLADADNNIFSGEKIRNNLIASGVQTLLYFPFHISANVDVGPGVTKTMRLSSKDYSNGATDYGLVYLATNNRWYNWFRIK